MNQVVSQARLFRALALRPRLLTGFVPLFMFTTLATIVASGATFWAQIVLVALMMWVIRPAWVDYQALSLGSVTWRRHRRWLGAIALTFALLVALLLRTLTPAGDDTALIYPVLVAVSLLIVVDSPVRGIDKRQRAERGLGRFLPVDPVNQIIRAPQLTMWTTLWVAALVYLLIRWGLEAYMGGDTDHVTGFIFLAVYLPIVLLTQRPLRSSLRQWVAIGGTRGRWARETWAVGGVNVVLGAVGAAVMLSRGGSARDGAMLFAVIVLFLVGSVILELVDVRTIGFHALPLVAIVAVLVAHGFGAPAVLVTVGALASYAGLGWSVHHAAARVSVFTHGVTGARERPLSA
ncbi:hypothetical protein SAMN06295981_1013 [Corynebacterium pollutisoli]|uniref:Uncharacterized protein n=1 Tax=Corynebacterium pollutisoli TaxID=1610489 RepID=A0A1X7IWP5_9CORY|nr:hypothetical protein [Corynebacterium pollutisoli]SMG18906.1 hypothetical protein SAMN06295981_1013 [Corynebacterium pollutisoli]